MEHTLNKDTIIDFIADIFARRGAESYLGEPVTMAQHMLQAAQKAQEANAGDDMVAAALLHDIGHYTGEFPEDALESGIDNLHEKSGASVLEPYFPSIVVNCVRHHVSAKRYLCATRPQYLRLLSDASVHSLDLQGGPMNDDEVQAFEQLPDVQDIVRVRYWDDGGKDATVATSSFEDFVPLLRRVVANHTAP